MSNTLIFDNFSTIRNTTVESSSSEEDQRDDQDKLDKLYEFIGAPNPLPEEKKVYSSDVKTAYKLHFSQLPSALYSASTTDHAMFENINKIEEEIASTLHNLKKPEKDNQTAIVPINQTKTLFNLYPRTDSRLVYSKYKDQGDWELNIKGYANYLINISNIIRNKDVKVQYLSRNVTVTPPVVQPRPNALHFNSNFESGNLYSAFKISDFEYDLILQNDINSRGHTQWFFFSIANTMKGRTVKFNMVNLLKPESLFNEGMKPLVFSTKDNESRGDGWKRAGFDVSYTRNNIQKEGDCTKSYYTLSFSYTFKEDNDTIFFAHCFPYTYTDLKTFLTKICADPARKMYIVRKTLCYTLAQNECEYLSITSPYNLENVDKRCGVVITARQHPGESLSSYMMEGFIEFITSEDPEAQYLRKYCVFKVVPMLNPDGVIHGNYRSSLCGRDLNRIWNKASPTIHPTIYHTKELIRKLQTRRKLHLICDLHGHSRKKNAFFYGNATEANPYKARMFPLIMSKVSKYVTFEDCRFAVQRSKESTARIALWREHKSENIFTLEASFFGYDQGGEVVPFTKEDYRKLGADLGKAIFIQLKQMNLENLKTSAVQTTGAYGDAQDFSIPKSKPALKDLAARRRSRSMQMNDDNVEVENENEGKKVFLEDQLKPSAPLRTSELMNSNNLLQELKANKKLIEMGNRDDSGSDTDLSDEEISNKELQKVLPVKSQGKLKKKKTKDGSKKKGGSVATTRRDDEKDKKDQVTKADGATNTVGVQNNKPKQELTAAALAKPKMMKKFRVVTRDSATQQRLYSAGTGKDAENPAEMVSVGIQTDECGLWDYDEPGMSAERGGILYPNFPKAFRRSKSPQATSSARGRLLFIQGEKTGVDMSSGIDTNYKLGKNQISRSILAKLNPKMIAAETNNNNNNIRNANPGAFNETRREYQGFVGHIKKLGSIQLSSQEVRAKMSVVKQVEEANNNNNQSTTVGKGVISKEANAAAYYMKYKEIENKVNASRPETYATIDRSEDVRNNYRKSAHASSLENSEKKHTASVRNLENNDPLSEEREMMPAALTSNYQKFNNNNNPNITSSSNKQRLNSKDKPPVPLPRLLPMLAKKLDTKEPLATDLSSFINNTRKIVNGDDVTDDSFVKAKLLKFTGQPSGKAGSCITSGRESIELNVGEKYKEKPNAVDILRENYALSRMSDYTVHSSAGKDRPKSPKKRSSAKLERIVATDVKVNVERKNLIGALNNIVSPTHISGRRSQNSVLKKF